MTPKERAEKINKYIHGFHSALDNENFIAAHIEEAEREAFDNGRKSVDVEHEWNLGRLSGWTAAREKAMGIVEWHEAAMKRCQEVGIAGDIVPLAVRISEMQPDEKESK